MSNKLASLDALTRFWTNTKTYIQKYVSSFVNNKLSNFIQKSDIINNFTSTDATKVAAAPTVKSLNDSINQLNMNFLNLAGMDIYTITQIYTENDRVGIGFKSWNDIYATPDNNFSFILYTRGFTIAITYGGNIYRATSEDPNWVIANQPLTSQSP